MISNMGIIIKEYESRFRLKHNSC